MMKIKHCLTIIALLPYIILFALLLLCLLTYHPQDVEDTYPFTESINNDSGIIGAYIAHFCYSYFGIMAYGLPALVILLYMLAKADESLLYIGWWIWGIITFFWCSIALTYWQPATFKSTYIPSWGGLVGEYLLLQFQIYIYNSMDIVLIMIGIGLFICGFSLFIENIKKSPLFSLNNEK